jgi:NAD+ kinase
LIVSSPTGSTAYSLSGNGPIISPDVQAITLLPMFPHSLNARTLIISQLDNIRLTVRGDSKAYLSLDSHNNIKLDSKSNVNIYKAERELTLIHPTDHSFFSSCRDKLGWSLGIPVSNTL